MKKYFVWIIPVLGISLLHFTADDVARFGTSPTELKANVVKLASYNRFPGFNFYQSPNIRKACLSIPVEQRAVAARTVAKIVKAIVMDPHFKTIYEKKLTYGVRSVDPSSSEWKRKLHESYLAELSEVENNVKSGVFNDDFFALTRQMAEAQRQVVNKPGPNGDSVAGQKIHQTILTGFKENVADGEAVLKLQGLLKSDPAEFARQYATIQSIIKIRENIATIRAKNDEIIARAEEKRNYKANIKAQLQQFLEESAEIDFTAKILKVKKHNEFADEAYRKKSKIWKQCFRMGKPATNAFREVAQGWVAEL